MSVNSYHPDYNANIDMWLTIRDVINNDATSYLRTLDPLDKGRENRLRNDAYQKGAVLVNFTALTQQGLTGLIFRKPPIVRLPQQVAYLKEEACEDGRTLQQMARDLVIEMITIGRAGVLVDFPRSEGDLETMDNDLKAKLSIYKAEDIINWNVGRVNGKLQLTMVVLQENRQQIQSDGFTWQPAKQYRVLRLEKGVYKQELHSIVDGKIHTATPKNYNGEPWTKIPFIFTGSENNNAQVDKSPLKDIALLNIAHFKNSADLEESGHVVGQPTLILKSSMDFNEFAEANPGGLKLGCRAAYNVGAEGDAKFLQVNPNQLIAEMMKQKEHQASFIGARLIAPAGGRETAEAARMRFGSSNSALGHLGANAEYTINTAIKWVCDFQGANPSTVKYKLNDQYFDEAIDPQVIMQGIMLVNENLVPRSTMQNYARRVGFVEAEVDNEELDREIEKTQALNKELLEDDSKDVLGEDDNDNTKGQTN